MGRRRARPRHVARLVDCKTHLVMTSPQRCAGAGLLTRVELEHRGVERQAASAEGVHGGVSAPGGWRFCLELFANEAAG